MRSRVLNHKDENGLPLPVIILDETDFSGPHGSCTIQSVNGARYHLQFEPFLTEPNHFLVKIIVETEGGVLHEYVDEFALSELAKHRELHHREVVSQKLRTLGG